jgi:hypothetical protein
METNTRDMKKLIILIMLPSFMLLTSCGARKVTKAETKEESKIESTDNSIITSNIDTFTKLSVNNKDESVTTENVFEPIDNTKEASIIDSNGKKTVLNNSRKIVRNVVEKNNTVSDKQKTKKEAINEQKNIKQVNASKKENISKAIDKKQFNPFMLLFLIIPLGAIWFFYRKYKNLPFVPKI